MKKNTLDDIYKTYMNDVYRYLLSKCCNKDIAEDIMQETFYRAYLYFEDCPNKGIKPWLFRVAHNTYIDYLRKNNRSHIKDNEFFNGLSDYKTPEDKILVNETIKDITKIIENMPQKQKDAILLCDFNGLSYKEASDIMKVSLSYFKVLLFRARQHIKSNIERNESYE